MFDGHQEVREATAKSAVPLPRGAVPAAGLTGQLLWGGGLFGFLVLTRNFISDPKKPPTIPDKTSLYDSHGSF